MKVLVINAILYTAECSPVKRNKSIKDTMIYDFCLAFHQRGHEVILLAGEPYKPINNEDYPFNIIWGRCILKTIFKPHLLPFIWNAYSIVKSGKYDLIISSEVFSMNTFFAYIASSQKVFAWHEIAKHNALFKQVPSKIWYNFVTRVFMKNMIVIGRSEEAKNFIKKYCNNTLDEVIDHGVNLEKFKTNMKKSNSFVVCSQLIKRKRIDGILTVFSDYLDKYDNSCILYIIGSGEEENDLKVKASELNINSNVVFLGKKSHDELLPLLSEAKAMLVNTEKDNNMISIVESIAVGTPVVTTDVPLNASYIKKYCLGIAKKKWTEDDLKIIVDGNEKYVKNCIVYREQLSTGKRVGQFIDLLKKVKNER